MEKANWQDIEKGLQKRYTDQVDPWGFDYRAFLKGAKLLAPLYQNYFRVRVFGAENIPKKNFMAISNHSGQIPIDGVLITLATLFHSPNQRVLRSMVERFLVQTPFLGSLVAKAGSILGDRENCRYLIEREESILVFPEGVRGIAKSTSNFYQVQPFTTGFYRLCLEHRLPILPIAVVGAEEMYPKVYHNKTLAKLLNIPALPLTPLFPLLGPLGMLPMPAPIDIYFGKPIPIKLKKNASPDDIQKELKNLQQIIQSMINENLPQKRPYLSFEEQQKLKKTFQQTLKQFLKYATRKI